MEEVVETSYKKGGGGEASNTSLLDLEEYDEVFTVTQIMSDIKKKTHSEYKYIEHYQAKITDLGKTIFTVHNIKF